MYKIVFCAIIAGHAYLANISYLATRKRISTLLFLSKKKGGDKNKYMAGTRKGDLCMKVVLKIA